MMGVNTKIISPLKQYANTLGKYTEVSGRTSRGAFWRFTLIDIAIFVSLLIVGIMIFMPSSEEQVLLSTFSEIAHLVTMMSGLALIYFLITLPARFCIQVRRLHDIGIGMVWVVAYYLIQAIAILGPQVYPYFMSEVWVMLYLSSAISLITVIYTMVLLMLNLRRGNPTSNRFGPPQADTL